MAFAGYADMGSNRASDRWLSDDNYMVRQKPNRTISPSADQLEGSPGSVTAPGRRGFDEDEGQLGPDELPDPAEVVMNHEAKLHH
jgi:hypothetical protein